MKKILSLVLVSALGGVFTLGAYKLFLEPEQQTITTVNTPTPTYIPTNNVNSLYNSVENPDFTVAAENAVNAVVHVKNVSISSGQITLQDFFQGRSPQRAQLGTGSGVIINAGGYIITNNHVINNAHELSVTLNNNKTYKAKIIGTDPKTDIALLKIEADEDLPFVTFGDSDNTKIGEWVLAVGNPYNLTSTVTAGIISAKARDLSGGHSQSFLQTDAAVNPGNSGGALVNTNGELIGINTAISSQTGSYIGYSFAVPSNIARKVIEDIMEYGNVQNAILGISTINPLSKEAIEKGINTIEGVYVYSVEEHSGAEKAGIIQGDIIKEIDNISVSKFADLTGHLSAKRPNDVVNLTVSRNGNLKTLPVTLLKNEVVIVPIIGTLKNATKEQLKKFNLNSGLIISNLDKNNKDDWEADGVDIGSIVTAINGKKVNSIEDIEAIKNSKSNNALYHVEIVKKNGEKVNYRFR